MKKMFGFFALGLLSVFMMGIVSAGPVEDVGKFIGDVYTEVSPAVGKLVGATPGADMFLAKILFLIIIFAIAWKSMEKIPFFEDTPWVLWLVSASVSILAIRWFGNAEIVNTVLLPYSAFGIALTAGLPFVLYFFITKDFHTTLRKLSWSFFIVVFIGLWFMRSGAGELAVGNFAYIYLATAGLGALVLWFDGTIQGIMSKARIDKIQSYTNSKIAGDLRDELRKLTTRWKEEDDGYQSIYGNKTGLAGYNSDRKKIQAKIAALTN
jgi:hypothetical protein